MPWPFRDVRHAIERAADDRYAAVREGRVIEDDIVRAVSGAADRVRMFTEGIREGRRMSLLGKMKALTESAEDFTRDTHASLDGISEKIAVARGKRDAAVNKHHNYYDTVIAGVEESVEVIDRLSNGPLSGDGEN
jgi:hypothetical protein